MCKTNIEFIAATKLSYLAMQSNNLLHQIMKFGQFINYPARNNITM